MFAQAEVDYQQAEQVLVEERNLLDTVLDYLPIQVYVKDLQSRFVLANAATRRGLRITSREEYLGKTDFDRPENRGSAPGAHRDQKCAG